MYSFNVLFFANCVANRLWKYSISILPKRLVANPQKKNLDLNFFTLAAGPEFDFKVKYIGQERRPSYPFVELDGMDEDYYYYTLTYF